MARRVEHIGLKAGTLPPANYDLSRCACASITKCAYKFTVFCHCNFFLTRHGPKNKGVARILEKGGQTC